MAKAGWTNPDLKLYNGTIDSSAKSILGGITLASGRSRTDFGQGFYTTTSELQARHWANKQTASFNKRNPGLAPEIPAVVEFIVERETLAQLDSIWFVRGDRLATDYWDLIRYFRSAPSLGKHHQRKSPKTWYDLVVGPVAASWMTVLNVLVDSDQISFHTNLAVAVLNGLPAHKKRQLP